ncbi:hypothetical protein GGE07_005837 [Sinorhizobium terangae]|nr:hypothetical protein [Sinorhizobium terangae]
MRGRHLERAEGALRSVLHALVEGIDDPVFEVGASRIGGYHGLSLAFAETVKAAPDDIHSSPGLDEKYLRVHVLGDPGSRVKCNCIPDIGFGNAVCLQEVTSGGGAVHFEAKLTFTICGRQPDVVKHRGHVEQFGIEPEVLLFPAKAPQKKTRVEWRNKSSLSVSRTNSVASRASLLSGISTPEILLMTMRPSVQLDHSDAGRFDVIGNAPGRQEEEGDQRAIKPAMRSRE